MVGSWRVPVLGQPEQGHAPGLCACQELGLVGTAGGEVDERVQPAGHAAHGEASGQPVQLFRGRFAHNERNLPMYDVTPDGRRFVIVMAGEEEYAPVNLNVVVNLGDELRRRVPAK